MKLVSMKVSQQEQSKPAEVTADAPRYPWGLALNLDEQSLEKLGVGKLPDVGDEWYIVACCKVTSVSSNEHESGKYRSVGLQITKMGLEQEKGDAAGTLYNGDKADK